MCVSILLGFEVSFKKEYIYTEEANVNHIW